MVFESNLTSTGGGSGNIHGCTCMVKTGATVVISSNDTVTIHNEVVNSGGTLTFENNASLVQVNATAINSGDIIYKRTSTPMENFDYTYWSSPVADQTYLHYLLIRFGINNLSYTGNAWKEELSPSIMQSGIGYIIRTPKEKI